MQLLKTYIPYSHEPVWHLYDHEQNTLKSFSPSKGPATDILNRLQNRNKRPRAHQHTFYDYLVSDTDPATSYYSNTFVFTGKISDNQKRFFHFIKLSSMDQLQPLQPMVTLQSLARQRGVYIGYPKSEAEMLKQFQVIETFLNLANRPVKGPLKSFATWEIADMVAAYSKYHCKSIGVEPIRLPDTDLIMLAAHHLGVEIVHAERQYLNRVQQGRLRNHIKLPRKFHGDTINYLKPWPTRLQQTYHDRFHGERTAHDESCMIETPCDPFLSFSESISSP